MNLGIGCKGPNRKGRLHLKEPSKTVQPCHAAAKLSVFKFEFGPYIESQLYNFYNFTAVVGKLILLVTHFDARPGRPFVKPTDWA